MAFEKVVTMRTKARIRLDLGCPTRLADVPRVDPVHRVALAVVWNRDRRESMTVIFLLLTAFRTLLGQLHQKGWSTISIFGSGKIIFVPSRMT